jgi:hypothetical protein
MNDDKARLDWFEMRHTLHWHVEILYVVDGYELTVMLEDSPRATYHGAGLREAIDKAIADGWQFPPVGY